MGRSRSVGSRHKVKLRGLFRRYPKRSDKYIKTLDEG